MFILALTPHNSASNWIASFVMIHSLFPNQTENSDGVMIKCDAAEGKEEQSAVLKKGEGDSIWTDWYPNQPNATRLDIRILVCGITMIMITDECI